MIRELRVRNFAIIDELALTLGEGLNVLTGETGAGKSILIGALGITLGERAYTEMIKTGRAEATVEAFFDLPGHPMLDEMGIDSSEGVFIRRSISSAGRSKAYINGTMVTLQALGELGKTLVDLHGQHEHQSLLSVDNQMHLLDHYGGLGRMRAGIAELYAEVQGLRNRIEGLRQGARDRAQRLDLLGYQMREVEGASVTPGEDSELEKERAILANLTRLNELLEHSYGDVYDSEGSISEKLSAVRSTLKEMAEYDGEVGGVLEVLEQAAPLVEEVSLTLRGFRDKYHMDPERLTEVEERLRLLDNLKKKYGDTLDAVIRYGEEAAKEAAELETSEETAGGLEEELGEKEARLMKECARLTGKRKEAGKKLARLIGDVLRELALEKSDFVVDMGEAPVSPTGADAVEFLFSSHRGESPPKPLNRVASGGELSRIMLAIKSVLRREDRIPVLVFDEVDSGIGGKTAKNVARRLKTLSEGRQVICITHLPQIASEADRHLLIEKTTRDDGVYVTLEELGGRKREEEVARMLSGKVTETSLRHAKEIIGRTA
jgi:DNA repair protein RecN (Recombination protein N)